MNNQLTSLLEDWREGDDQAMNQIMDLVYDHLKAVIHGMKQKAGGHRNLFSTTEIAHETYLKIQKWTPKEAWNHRGEFFALLGKMILGVLADEARQNQARKRGGDILRVSLSGDGPLVMPVVSAVLLKQVVDDLRRRSARQASLWECRFVVGFTARECAEFFGISEATVHRDLSAANGWLGFLLAKGSNS